VSSTYLGGSGYTVGREFAGGQLRQHIWSPLPPLNQFPDDESVQPGHGGNGDAFVASSLDRFQALVYSTYLGAVGRQCERHNAVAAQATYTSPAPPAQYQSPDMHPLQLHTVGPPTRSCSQNCQCLRVVILILNPQFREPSRELTSNSRRFQC